jgi:hypothetical protein
MNWPIIFLIIFIFVSVGVMVSIFVENYLVQAISDHRKNLNREISDEISSIIVREVPPRVTQDIIAKISTELENKSQLNQRNQDDIKLLSKLSSENYNDILPSDDDYASISQPSDGQPSQQPIGEFTLYKKIYDLNPIITLY